MSIQQMLLGAGSAVSTTTYIDDIFSTYLWKGTAAQKTITNGIDLSTKGGMVFLKSRSTTNSNIIADTERGINKTLVTETSAANDTAGGRVDQFNTDGFRVGNDTTANGNNFEMASSTWRKAPGFFDCVKWQGDGTAGRQISHSLGCVPGLIIIKGTDLQSNWMVYHRDLGDSTTNSGNFHLWLNGTSTKQDDNTVFNDTLPTASNFTVGTSGHCNGVNYNYVAYLFGGGASTNALARSVDFDGTGDYLTQPTTATFTNWWDQAFTVEYWVNADGFVSSGNGGSGVLGVCVPTSSSETWSFGPKSNGTVEFYYWNGSSQQVTTTRALNKGQWYHLAMCYDGSNSIKIYINGTLEKSATVQGTPSGDSNSSISIGKIANGSEFDGKVSNVRITHQALYASSFKPPVEPLTQTSQSATSSNVKLLYCNNSSVTGSTVTPNTITANGDPTASSDSPFDDPAGFVFGESGSESVISCGSYIGNGSTTGTEINLGWEPQWLLCKKIDNQGGGANTSNWHILDSMRGTGSGGANVADDQLLMPNLTNTEVTIELADFTSTGFKNTSNRDAWNYDGDEYIYVAIRRPDGYVGKQYGAGEGTSVFALDSGNSSATIPTFDSGFPVDFMMRKNYNANVQWTSGARLTGLSRLAPNENYVEVSDSTVTWDSNVGWGATSQGTSLISHMWKRHAGFDVVAYTGNDVNGHEIPHHLSKTPEMIWVKYRNSAYSWQVYHKGLNGGTTPQNYKLELNENDAEASNVEVWKNAPTSTHFTVGSQTRVNADNGQYIAMLFASVSNVSSVGSFTGDGTNNGSHEITCGFTPRFIIIKCVTSGVNYSHWRVWDSLNGLDGSGNESYLKLNDTGAKVDNYDYIDTTATGFKFNTNFGPVNGSGNKMIYYAHA